jgi:hypothetical protein
MPTRYSIRRSGGTPVNESVLHFDRAADGVDHAAELDDCAVAGAFDDPTVMGGNGGVDEIAAQPPDARQRAVLVSTGEPAVADNIRDQDRREFSGLAHCAAPAVAGLPQMPARVCLIQTGRTAHVRIPSVPSTKREGRLRVEFTRSPNRPATPAPCANETASIDVKHPLRIAASDASIGR